MSLLGIHLAEMAETAEAINNGCDFSTLLPSEMLLQACKYGAKLIDSCMSQTLQHSFTSHLQKKQYDNIP